eukprot:CAMPEP_0117653974 /NCGR_PEP_ID=MMETSP0804-20121206/3490_1 /TAXON_ID=1074897 /ORGANISM="Tetraselmis astigmatica, Strain CCMP880" /LENGTH=216 /DNA_ID=CAMNT_0005460211 /DNA_START=135 /DNA_END=785 /DNA_ORIENTATION=+
MRAGSDLVSWLAEIPEGMLRPIVTAAATAAQKELEAQLLSIDQLTPSTDQQTQLLDHAGIYWAYPMYSWTGSDGFLAVHINGSRMCFHEGAILPSLFFRAEAVDEYPGLLHKLFNNLDGLDAAVSQPFEETPPVLTDGSAALVVPGGSKFRSPRGFFYVLDSDKKALAEVIAGVKRTGGPNGEHLTNALHAFLLYELAKYSVTAQARPPLSIHVVR